MIFIHILFCSFVLRCCTCSLCYVEVYFSIFNFKPVENRGEDEVKLPDPTAGLLTEELPPSVILAANQDIIESSKKESLRHYKHVLKTPHCQGFLSVRTKMHCAMFLVVF